MGTGYSENAILIFIGSGTAGLWGEFLGRVAPGDCSPLRSHRSPGAPGCRITAYGSSSDNFASLAEYVTVGGQFLILKSAGRDGTLIL